MILFSEGNWGAEKLHLVPPLKQNVKNTFFLLLLLLLFLILKSNKQSADHTSAHPLGTECVSGQLSEKLRQ